MPYQLSWLVEGRVIHAAVEGEITVAEIQQYVVSVKAFLDSGTAVYIFTDLTRLEKFPMNLGLLNMLLADIFRHPNMSWGILITTNSYLKFLGSIVMEVAKVKWRVFATWQEGLKFLNQIDSTLPDLSDFA